MLAILHCCAFIDRTMIGGLLPLIRAKIPLSDAAAGWIVGTAFALPYAATALAVAALLKGRRPSGLLLVGGVVLWTGASVATGLAQSFWGLTAARAVLGIGQGMFVPVAVARLLDATLPARRGQALAAFVSGATIGRSLALLAVGIVLAVLATIAQGTELPAWRWLFVISAVPNGIGLIALAVRPAAGVAQAADAPADVTGWFALAPLFAVAIMPVLLSQAVMAWLPTLLVRERGMSPTVSALLIGAITLVSAPVGPIVTSRLVTRFAPLEARLPTLVLLAMATALVPLAGVVWLPTLLATAVSMTVMIVLIGIASFSGLFAIQLLIPPLARVSINGVYLAIATLIGMGAGPLLAGVFAAADHDEASSLGQALMLTGLVTTTFCALSLGATGRARRHAVRA